MVPAEIFPATHFTICHNRNHLIEEALRTLLSMMPRFEQVAVSEEEQGMCALFGIWLLFVKWAYDYAPNRPEFF